MKKNLNFTDPFVAQNPDDALIMSLLSTYHLENELLESFWDIGAMMFLMVYIIMTLIYGQEQKV